MKKILIAIVAIVSCMAQSYADERAKLLTETFSKVDGSMEATVTLDQSQLDNPSGWTFTDAYAGPQCVIIKKGGSVTTPTVAELTGNAAFYFSVGWWEDPSGKTEIDWENFKPHPLSITDGTLGTTELDMGVSVFGDYTIYDVGPTTRITLTASCDIVLTEVSIYYGNMGPGVMPMGDFTKFSHENDDYYNPFDLVLTPTTGSVCYDDGKHNILVYTLDGSEPQRTSTRYDGTPIHIDATTTVRTATIFGNGCMYQDKPRVYTFPASDVSLTPEIPDNTYEITVTKPGNLKAQLLDHEADVIEGLVLKGAINGADLKYLIDGEGRMAKLTYLDMEEITFDYDGSLYRTVVVAPEAGMGTTYVGYYYFSPTNYEERRSSSPTQISTNYYRNDLSGAFGDSRLKCVVAPKILTRVGSAAFPDVEMAILPDGIEEIGTSALSRCRVVNLPQSIRKIGDWAFGENLIVREIDLSNLEYVGKEAFRGAKITKFNFTDKLSHIGEGAFSGTRLTEAVLTVPGDTVPARLFAGCCDLRKVNISGTPRVLGAGAFDGSMGITDFTIPSTIEVVGTDAIPEYLLDAPEGGIIYVGKSAYKRTSDLSEYTVKEGTVSLTENLFDGAPLTRVTLPSSLRIIGDAAFTRTNLASTPQMQGVVRIGEYAFAYCNDLARVTIPESVEYIGGSAFYGCNALWSVTYNAVDAECPWGVSPRDLERIVIGDKVRRLPKGLYTGNTNVTEVTLPACVEILDPEVFANCSNLEYVRLSDNISTISERAFENCHSLRDMHWPAGLKTVGNDAFYKCSSLKTISLPEGTETLEPWAFRVCSGVETVYVASTITSFGDGSLTLDNAGKNVTITATAAVPQTVGWNWHYMGTPTIKVPAASLAAYKADPFWNGSNNGKENLIVSIEGISAPEEASETNFATGIDTDTDLGDTVVGDVYVTVGEEDGYDATDGSIVLNSTMDEDYVEAIGGMAPGESDIANRFNGLVVQVPAGNGTVTINCLTIGTRRVSVKIGSSEPVSYTKDSKGDITIDYSVTEDTYVYIYGSDAAAPQQAVRRTPAKAPSTDSCVKIYSVGVAPGNSGIGDIEADTDLSRIVEYYRIDGVRVDDPSQPGIYIGRRADGSSVKIMVESPR